MESHGGRADAYERLVVPEIPMLLRVALSLTPQPADAHDLVQDTLLRSWRSFETFDGRHPRAWLLTILRNANLNSHRKPRPDPIDPTDASRSLGGEVSASAEDQVVDPLLGATIESALAELKPEARQLVMLVDADGLSYAEAAAVLGVPEGTVMSRLHRARKKVKKQVVAAGVRLPGAMERPALDGDETGEAS